MTSERVGARDPRSKTQPHTPSQPRRTAVMERFLCERCGDMIGVYEPLVMCNHDTVRSTSRAAEPELQAADNAYYHRDCYAASESGQAPTQMSASGG
jgi:hypothetical protein